jgi:DNA-3-methyladenine glycosylase I
MTGIVIGTDGRARCGWAASTAEYQRYHDEEWGRPVTGERELFERISLEAFQSGLSWITILRKREAFRTAFADFDPGAVAAFDAADVDRLMADSGIVRNLAKINATILNARALLKLPAGETLGTLIAGFSLPLDEGPRSMADIPALTPESTALAKALKQRGFSFVGPTTAYATMQAVGAVNDHLTGCWVRDLGQ